MSFSVEQCIRELLFEQECVVIPHFGGFITSYKSAEIDYITNLLSPPTKAISFNRQLRNDDGILTHLFSSLNKVSYKEAQVTVREWSNRLDEAVKTNKQYTLHGIGVLEWNAENSTIQFKGVNTENFLAESYGFEPVNAVPIARSIETLQKVQAVEISISPEHESKKPIAESGIEKITTITRIWPAFALAACTLAALLMPLFNISVPSLNLNQASLYSVLSENLLPKPSFELHPIATQNSAPTFILSSVAEVKATPMIDIEIVKEETPAISTNTIADQQHFTLVMGAFKEEANATRLLAENNAKFPEFSFISFKKGGLTYVAIAAGNTHQEAQSSLQKAKAKNIDCWVKKR
jgi:cell division septation protein DedD